MAIRVRIKISVLTYTIETSALANSGYEAEECEIIIPAKLAQKLTLWPNLPENAKMVDYETAGGVVKFYHLSIPAEISIVVADKKTSAVKSNIVISETENEVLISDKLIEELNIELLKPYKGIWRFSDDPEGKLYESEKPEYW